MEQPFWKTKSLDAMSVGEWESLCDGCGRCCLVKLEDEDSGAIAYTDVGCKLLDGDTCRCRDYPGRRAQVPECVKLTPQAVDDLGWLPPTCAYFLVGEGRDLPWWHPLVSGSPETVHQAGISVRGRVFANEDDVGLLDLLERITKWPMRWPKRARRAPEDNPAGEFTSGNP